MTARHQVVLFLVLMKSAAASRFVLAQRKKNLDTLAQLGLSLTDAKDRVMRLTPDDYVEGPNPDGKRPGEDIWVFGLNIQGQEVYVKLCVIANPLLCTCISFHVADKPLSYGL